MKINGSTLSEINDKNIEDLAGSKYLVLKFGAVWCGPCRQIQPILEKLKNDIADVTFATCDVDESANMTVSFGIRNIPVIVFIKDGLEQRDLRLVGTQSEDKLRENIERLTRTEDESYSEFEGI